MTYGALVDLLENDDIRRTVTAVPDGSVDRYCTITHGGNRIDDRQTLGRKIAGDETGSFQIELDSREPAGQAVHMALQVDALGDDVRTVGHLEDPVFDELPFQTTSIGTPSEITVFPLEDDDVLFSRRSPDFDDWSLETLRTNATALDDLVSADALCWGNWALLEGATDAIAALATGSVASDVFVLDPGPVTVRSRNALRDLLEALGDLERTTDVIYSVNRTELEYTADAIGASGPNVSSDIDRLAAVREAAGITGAVVHAHDIAAFVAEENEVIVSNLDVEAPRRRTGAGDRFSGALAAGYVRGWDLDVILALGNCCASYYVQTATTGDRSELLRYLERKLALEK